MPAENIPSQTSQDKNNNASREESEQKYLDKILEEYQKTLTTYSSEQKAEKQKILDESFDKISSKLKSREDFPFGPRQKAILRLKLARYFQLNDFIDANTLYDAIIESPGFINKDKGSLHRLFELHEEKTLLRIAEMKKKRAEAGYGDGYNPWENLFTTTSGQYYMARLLNMPHLEKESAYMNHCVGTSDSYVNKIKRGGIEILSFRSTPRRDPLTEQMLGDFPIMTIEYNLKTKTIEQMKMWNDRLLDKDNSYYPDIIDALRRLRETKTDKGETRDFRKIDPNELENIHLAYDEVLTDRGIVNLQDFDPDDGSFVIKFGFTGVDQNRSKEDAVKIVKIVEGISCTPEELAYSEEEITDKTKVYIGPLFPGIFQLPTIENIYTSFPEGKIERYEVELGKKTKDQLETELEKQGIKIDDKVQDLFKSTDFQISSQIEKVKLIRLSVEDLGLDHATIGEIYAKASEYGLELCPPEVGPQLRLSYDGDDYIYIAMKPISYGHTNSSVFALGSYDEGVMALVAGRNSPSYRYSTPFVFHLREGD